MKTHVVYVIQAKTMGLLKIGCTSDFSQRIYALQTGSPDELVLLWRSQPMTQAEAYSGETYLQHKFSAFNVRREWYSPDPEILSFIEQMKLSASLVNAPTDIRFLDTLQNVTLPEIVETPMPARMPFRRSTTKHKCGRLIGNRQATALNKIMQRKKEI